VNGLRTVIDRRDASERDDRAFRFAAITRSWSVPGMRTTVPYNSSPVQLCNAATSPKALRDRRHSRQQDLEHFQV
jgi:hypothetical protein